MNRNPRVPILVAGAVVLVFECVSSGGCVASGPPPPSSGPYGRYDRPYYPPHEARYGYRQEQFARLAHELDDRAQRAHEVAEQSSARYGPREQEFFGRIHHFSDQAYRFHRRYEEGEIRDAGRLRGELQHLLDDARDTDNTIRRANVFPEVWEEWQGVLRVLQRMIDMVR